MAGPLACPVAPCCAADGMIGDGEIGNGGGLFFTLLGEAVREAGRELEGWKWAGG